MHPRTPKLLEDIRDAALGAYPQIIAFRNVLIHGYDLVDHALVWNAIERQLPVLLARVSALQAANPAG